MRTLTVDNISTNYRLYNEFLSYFTKTFNKTLVYNSELELYNTVSDDWKGWLIGRIISPNPTYKNYRNCFITELNWTNEDLSNSDFNGGVLVNSIVSECNLSNSNFTWCNLTNTSLINCNINNCNFTNTNRRFHRYEVFNKNLIITPYQYI